MSERLDVYVGDRRAGTITQNLAESTFAYDPSFPETNLPGRGIAFNLPRDRGPFVTPGTFLHPFFANLLPEGGRRQALADRKSLSLDDAFSFLALSGGDAIGDVAAVPHGASLPVHQPIPADQLAEQDFQALLDQDVASHSTIPGGQDKLSSAFASFPVATRNEPAILKLANAKQPHLVENEFFFMNAARKCGIETADCRLVHDRSGRAGLLVRRFDRKDGQKLHQEDGCQILNVYPGNKHAPEVRHLAQGIEGVVSASPVQMRKLLQLLSFSYLIGNADLHGKNVSVYYSPRGLWEITPAYDLHSSLPYSKLNRNMALKMDGRNDSFRGKDFLTFFERFRLPMKASRSILIEIIDSTSSWISDLEQIGFDTPKTNSIRISIEARRERLASFS